MDLRSSAFEPGEGIPVRHTCDGEDVSPPLVISELPAAAVSLVLVMDDPDAPGGTWDHWVEYDIRPSGAIPEAARELGTAGVNSWGTTGYRGPCPPSGTHRYVFTAYALDTELGLEGGTDKKAVLGAMAGHVLAEAGLTGTYARP